MSSHNRRDPKLPDLTPVDQMDRGLTWQQVMARAKDKLVIQPVKSKWEKYGKNAISAAEQANPKED